MIFNQLFNHKKGQIMKKLFTISLGLILLLWVSNASAYTLLTDFTIDFTAIDADFSTHNNVNYFSYDATLTPNTFIKQYLGADNQVSNGDYFEESGFMTLGTVTPGDLLNPIDLVDDDGSLFGIGTATPYAVNIWYDGLSGTISEYDDKGTPTTDDDTWKYTFDSGVGTVGWYLDDDYDPTNGHKGALLTGHVVPVSSGTADSFLSGLGVSSNWDVTAMVDTLIPNFLLDENGNDLLTTLVANDYLLTITTGDTTITETKDPQFDPTRNEFFIEFTGRTGDNTQLGVVPEPTTALLFGIGLLGLANISRKRIS